VPIYNIEVIGNIAYLVQPGQIGAIPLASVEEDPDAFSEAEATTLIGAAVAAVPLIPFGAFITGNYYNSVDLMSGSDLSQAGNALTADTIHFSLFRVPKTVTFDRVAVTITGGAVTATLRIGAYTVGADGLPASLIADWGTVDATAAATPELTMSWSPTAGWYYIAQVSNAAPSTARISGGLPVSPFGRSTKTFAPVTDWTKASVGSNAALPSSVSTFGATGTHRPIWFRVG
jgi:hypothetical protein